MLTLVGAVEAFLERIYPADTDVETLAEATHANRNTLRGILGRLVERKKAEHTTRGRYKHRKKEPDADA